MPVTTTAVSIPPRSIPSGSAPAPTLKAPVRSGVEEPEANGVPTREELEAKVRAFEEKTVTKRLWAKWRKKLADVIAWAEAVEHSDAYHTKLRSRKSLQSLKEARLRVAEKRRRVPSAESGSMIEGGSMDVSPSKKRQRKKRISDYQEPRTDEEIARRFKEVCLYLHYY